MSRRTPASAAGQKDLEANNPKEPARVPKRLEGMQQDFNRAQSGGKKVSLADLIVLGGEAQTMTPYAARRIP